MLIKEAKEIAVSLSKPSKMPCYGYSLPAKRCQIGMKLKKVKGSICASCYALRGNYTFPKIQEALEKRYQAIFKPEWEDAMVALINKQEKSGFFRWHDSGDLQGVEHLRKIVNIANRLPHIKFWLPTREYQFVGDYKRQYGDFPKNLVVRLSGLMMDGKAPAIAAKNLGILTSGASATDYNCPAHKQNNKCGDCRKCWNKNIFQINYKKH